MAHSFKLGFKQNPSGADDYVELATTGSNTGYFLKSFGIGAKQFDGYGRPVRDLSIDLEVRGASYSDAIAKKRTLDRYIEQTRLFLKPFEGNIPASTDGTWQNNRAATLTVLLNGGTIPCYWDVLGGEAIAIGNVALSADTANYIIQVQLKLTCNYAARGALVTLTNVVAMGAFGPPFSTSTTNGFNCGWTFANTTDWTISTDQYKYGFQTLKWSASSSTAANTNATVGAQTNDYFLASIAIRGTISAGTLTVKLQKNDGAWADVETFVNTTGSAISNTAWTTFTASQSYNSGLANTQWRILITSPTSGTLYFDAVALWHSYKAALTAIPTEFMEHGRTAAIPAMNIYNVQGDCEAPIILYLGVASGNSSVYYVGGTIAKPTAETPFYGLDFKVGAGVGPQSSIFWNVNGTTKTGSGSLNVSQTAGFNRNVTLIPKRYRAFLVYASSQNTFTNTVQLKFGQLDPRTFNVVLPSTYNDAAPPTAPTASQYSLYDLGDVDYPRAGGITTERLLTAASSIVVSFTSTTLTAFGLAGAIMLPAEKFVSIDLVANTGIVDPLISSETLAPQVQLPVSQYNLYQTDPLMLDLTNFSPGATATVDNLYLSPGDNRFEILTLTTRLSKQYTYVTTIGTFATVLYQPRYLNGIAG
jgi:hypothetical protein